MSAAMNWTAGLPLSGPVAAALEAAGENYEMPLVCRRPVEGAAVDALRGASAAALFPGARSPEGALAGLWLYLQHFDACHRVAQDLPTPEGSYWHGILHRQEPDDWNAGYWFRAAGAHPIHEALCAEAQRLAAAFPGAHWKPASRWDPEDFIRFCARARREPGTDAERLARAVQMAEWRLLFAWCLGVRG
ncbi:MAG: hypothetical protein N2036_09940 [Bryobacteraceae bacterium]|nr:hypothetical protein [Bryobacteraceae bacterium]MCX7604383.1 hypothetical protein [Bryobacteraceae bacterium]